MIAADRAAVPGIFLTADWKAAMTRNSRSLIATAPLATALLAAFPSHAVAAPVALHTMHEMRSVSLPASVADAWAKLGQFPDLTWVAAVKASSATKGNSVGSVRSLDFGGGTLTETLVKYSASKHSYTYKINDTAENRKLAPVSNVVASITVSPAPGSGSILSWSFAFRREDQSASPAAGLDDAAARKQIIGTLTMGMAGATRAFPAK